MGLEVVIGTKCSDQCRESVRTWQKAVFLWNLLIIAFFVSFSLVVGVLNQLGSAIPAERSREDSLQIVQYFTDYFVVQLYCHESQIWER